MMKFLVLVGVLSASLTTMAAQSLVPVTNVSVQNVNGAQSADGLWRVIDTVLTFSAYSVGSCEVFEATVVSKAQSNVLGITKSRVPHCTRPEYAVPKLEQRTLKLEGSLILDKNPLQLANPLLVLNPAK